MSMFSCFLRDEAKEQTDQVDFKQVAQWAKIAHHGASIMLGDTIIYNAQRQITLNLKQ